jgi:peptide/nickel transport system permease protein
MLKFLARQLLLAVPTVLLLTFFVFSIIFLIPGDPAEALLGNTASPEAIAAFRHKMRLDQPLLVQYVAWLNQLLHGNLGASVRTSEPVWTAITARLPVTLQLSAYAMIIAIALGVPLGALAATRRNSLWDLLAQLVGLSGLAMPSFFLALLLILLVSLRLRWLPVSGYVAPSDDLLGSIKSLLLPSLTLSFTMLGSIARMTRTSMLEVLGEQYIVTARAKGLRERTVVRRHALKSALIPIVTLIGLQFGFVLGGTIVIEKIFGLPGIGRLMIDNVYAHDFPVVQGVLLFLALIRLGTNLITDVVYAALDPQVRLE